MKELSVEEKVKRYDEAIKKFDVILNLDIVKESGTIFADDVRKIFPELKESKEINIWKAIKSVVSYNVGSNKIYGASKEDMLAWLEKQGEQKPIDKVEPKFKVGDWTICCDYEPLQIISIRTNAYKMSNGDIRPFYMIDNNPNIRPWTIADAKDGDVLHCWIDDHEFVLIYKGIKDGYITTYGHLYQKLKLFSEYPSTMFCRTIQGHFTPATKEQCDQLEKAMADAGYTFDFEKKELKKIEQKPSQEIVPFETEHGKYYYCIKDYFCGGKKQASKGDVVQALRGLPIIGLKDASEYFLPVNFIKCNSSWSEEDVAMLDSAIAFVEHSAFTTIGKGKNNVITWLKNLKDGVLSQPKQEWNEEDEEIVEALNEYVKNLDILYSEIKIGDKNILLKEFREKVQHWLKSLRPQSQWKPSEEQIKALKEACDEHWEPDGLDPLYTLWEQLKKLREE